MSLSKTASSDLVDYENIEAIVTELVDSSVNLAPRCRQLASNVLDGAVCGLSTSATAEILAEEGAIVPNDPGFEQFDVSSVKAVSSVKFSSEIEEDSVDGLNGVTVSMSTALTSLIDSTIWSEVVLANSVNSTASDIGSLTLEEVEDQIGELADLGQPVIYGHRKTYLALKAKERAAGFNGPWNSIVGLPFVQVHQAASSGSAAPVIAVGHLDQGVGFVGRPARVKRLVELHAVNDQIGLTSVIRFASKLLDSNGKAVRVIKLAV